jgi:hypothetical protein
MVYYFKLASDMSKELVEVRLQSENGHFFMYIGRDFIPSKDNFTFSGDDRAPLDFNIKGSPEDNDSDYVADSYQTYYVKVVPQQLAV